MRGPKLIFLVNGPVNEQIVQVLIPVFALGRAQELCILLETYWERMNLKVPIYFSGGMAEKANNYYKLFISWTNEKIKKTFVERNMFDFKVTTNYYLKLFLLEQLLKYHRFFGCSLTLTDSAPTDKMDIGKCIFRFKI